MRIFVMAILFLSGWMPLYAGEIVISSSTNTCPGWVKNTNEWVMGTNIMGKCVYFSVGTKGPTLKEAEFYTKAKIFKTCKEHINTLIYYELMITLGMGDDLNKPYIEKIREYVSKNFNTSDLVKNAVYWENVRNTENTETYYNYFIQFYFKYETIKLSMIEICTMEQNSKDPDTQKKAKEILQKLTVGK
jgi:hypothetical protein